MDIARQSQEITVEVDEHSLAELAELSLNGRQVCHKNAASPSYVLTIGADQEYSQHRGQDRDYYRISRAHG